MPKALFVRMIRALCRGFPPADLDRSRASRKTLRTGTGKQERKDLMNAIRPLVEARVYPPVEFVIDRLRVSGNWASPSSRRNGREANRLTCREQRCASRRTIWTGSPPMPCFVRAYGRWNIVDYAIGPTDVFWSGDPLYDQLTPGLVPR
ncbi:MAG: hypothetical protein HPM95_11240 [Alphaproteobacteria bacterium]|nr:hypothetical protein [Alphaproteobacteria bacterium]